MKKKIYYWGPFLDNVATVKAMVNSAKSINRYSSKYSSTLIDAMGEWKYFERVLSFETHKGSLVTNQTER